MKYILTLLAKLWCAYRKVVIHAYNYKNKGKGKGWYGYDVQDLKEQYNAINFLRNNHTWFNYQKYYECDNYELVRRVRIFNYLVIISYYRYEGFHKELGIKTPAEIESDKIVNLFNHKKQVYTYYKQGDMNVQK